MFEKVPKKRKKGLIWLKPYPSAEEWMTTIPKIAKVVKIVKVVNLKNKLLNQNEKY